MALLLLAATLFGGPQWPAHHFAHAPHAAADPGALASAFAAGGVSVVAAGAALAVLHGVNAFVAADADNDGDGEKEDGMICAYQPFNHSDAEGLMLRLCETFG